MTKKILIVIIFPLILFYSGLLSAKKPVVPNVKPLPPLCESIGEISAKGCKNNPQMKKLGCDDIRPVPSTWGGLNPPLAMGKCLNLKVEGSYFDVTGCSLALKVRLIALVQKGKQKVLKLIESRDEFVDYFTPIESANEAMSFITAMTDSYPILKFPKDYFIYTPDERGTYLTGNLKTTEVKEKKNGYLVRLFKHPECGCHRPELKEIEYFVTRDGKIEKKKERIIWQAHRHYEICID